MTKDEVGYVEIECCCVNCRNVNNESRGYPDEDTEEWLECGLLTGVEFGCVQNRVAENGTCKMFEKL
jgi:hypothetical protein